MNTFEKIIHFLEPEMTRPTNYGWFHLMFFGIVILSTVLLCVFFKNCRDKTFRKIMLIGWVIMLALEIYKQLVFSFELGDDGTVTWEYLWYAFPYQLCSTPLYVLPFVAFMKESGVRDAFVAYMSLFALFGGVAVYFYPNDVFVQTIGINIQTMIHHGLQIVLGIFCTVYCRKKFNTKFLLKSIAVFAGAVTIAVLLNEAVYGAFNAKGIEDAFNMFYISRHFECTLPILSSIYAKVPYVAFIAIYIFGFAVISVILYLIQKGIILLTKNKVKNDKQ